MLARELPGAGAFEAFRCREEEDIFRAELERRAAELGLQPLRWPDPFPFDSALAMRVATYAKSIGRAVPFAQAAFRQAFAGGRLARRNRPRADRGRGLRDAPHRRPQGRRAALGRDCSWRAPPRAAQMGVIDVPAVRVGERVFHGERAGRAGRRIGAVSAPAHRTAGSMKANRAYRLIVTRAGRAPALLADAERVDHIEVVEIDGGEVVLFWDRPPRPPRGWRARCARTWPSWRRRSSSRAGVPWSADAQPAGAGRRARVAGHDDAHPPLRGARGRDVRAGEGRRLPAPVDRRGGHDRRQRAGAARRATT